MNSHSELIHELKSKLNNNRRNHKPSSFHRGTEYLFIGLLIAIDLWLLQYIYNSLCQNSLEESYFEPRMEFLDSLHKINENESDFLINSFHLENLNNLLLFVEREGLLHNDVTKLLSKNNITMDGTVSLYSNAVGPAKFAKFNQLIKLYFVLRNNLHRSLVNSEQAIRKRYKIDLNL